MTDHPNVDAWAMTGTTTQHLRQTAQMLRDSMSGVELPNGQRSEADQKAMAAIKHLAIAADHIDRIEQTVEPVIVQIVLSSQPLPNPSDGDFLHLIGLDTTGQLWQYLFSPPDRTPGWHPMQSGLSTPVPTPVDDGTKKH